MKKFSKIILLLFLPGFLYGQSNLVPNFSFETGAGTPFCQNVTINDISPYIDNWNNAHLSIPCIGSECKTSDWYDYSLCVNLPQPQTSNRFMGMTDREGIRNELASNLIQNHVYKLSFKFASGALNGHVRVFFTKFGPHWNANPNTTQNERLEVDGALGTDISGFQQDRWFTKAEYFKVPINLNSLRNIVFVQEDGYVYIDDVELIDQGCCPEFRLYENTSNLPAKTSVVDYIKAGFDAGLPNTSGNVTVLTGQNVTFKAGNQIILLPGFSTQVNSNFQALIEPCDEQFGNTGDINIAFLPNVFTPNGDGVNDNLCFNVTGAEAFSITVFNSFGQIVHEQSGPVTANFVCAWDGRCDSDNVLCGNSHPIVSDGTYYYVITFYNCDNYIENASFVSVFTQSGGRMASPVDSSLTLTNNSEFKIFPNPSNGIFTVSNSEEIKKIEVFDLLGNKVFADENISGKETEIDFSNSPKGIYFARISTGDKTISQKIIIQ